MALDIELSLTIASDRETFTITDDTVYGTGGNPARAALRVFMSAYKMSADNTSDEITLVSDTEDPETCTSFQGDYGVDGWYKFYFVAVPEYDGGTTYDIYDAVFDTDNSVYRSKQNSNVGNALNNSTYWEPISDPATLAANKDEPNESANISSLIYQRVLTANSQYAYSNDISENCVCSDCDPTEVIQNYNYFSFELRAAIIADERIEVIKGEVICRKLQSRFIDNC